MLWLALRFTALPDDPGVKTDLLKRLAALTYDHTPYIKRYADSALVLEISRCLQLFGGLKFFCERLEKSLDSVTSHYQMGLAHTDKAAWLLSFQQHKIDAADDQAVFLRRLDDVPLDYLFEHPKPVRSLQQMGMSNLGDLLALPSVELGRRFGKDFVSYLQEIRGVEQTLPEIYQVEETFRRQVCFGWPVKNTDQLEAAATGLLQKLVDFLVRNQWQSRQISWRFYSARHTTQEVQINCERIHARWHLLFELTRIHFAQIRLDFEVEILELECCQCVPVDAQNQTLFQQERQVQVVEQAEALVARLQARLGQKAVYQVHLQTEHLPEYSQTLELPFAQRQAVQPGRGVRPCWLLNRPQPLREQQGQIYWQGRLQLLRGPERIQGYWWEQPRARDYFVARRTDALHCWIFQDIQNRHWYAQGIFA